MSALDTALTAGNLTTLRGTAHAGKLRLAVAPQTTIATALINQVSFDVPLASVTVDNTSADWLTVREGMTAWIGTSEGAADIGVYLVRKAPGATTLYLMELASGDPGLLATRTTKALQDNAFVTIKSAPNLWSVFPRIAYTPGGQGTFYKKYDVTFSDQNTTGGAVPAIVNIGEHVAVYVGDGGTYTDERSATVDLFDGTVATYAWSHDASGTVVSGAVDTAAVGIQYPPGNYIISLTVTTSGGASITVDRHLWVYDDSTNPVTEVQVTNHSISMTGARFTCEIIGDLPDDILKGAMVMLWEETDSTAIASATTKAIGFVESVSATATPGGGAVLSVASPFDIMGRVRGFSQILKAVTTPATWAEASAALCTLDFFIFYILYWHTTLLRLFDFETSGRSRAKFIWKANTGTWLQAVNSAAELDDLMLTQDSHGNLYLKRDPQMMTTSEKSAVVVRATFGEDDIVEDSLSYQRDIRATTGKIVAFGLSTDTTSAAVVASAATAAGGAGGQGIGEARLDRLASASELRVLAGNLLAKANNSIPRMGFNLMTNYAVIEPALRYYVTLDVDTAELLPVGEALTFSIIPTEVHISYEMSEDRGAYRSSIGITAVADTDGNAAPGVDEPITARDGLDVHIPKIGLDGLPEFDFDMFIPPIDWALPSLPTIVPTTSTAVDGTPGTATEGTALIAWGATAASNGTVYYTAAWEEEPAVTTWAAKDTVVGSTVQQCLPAKGSRTAVYALYNDRLRYTDDIGNSAFVTLATFTGDAHLMRMTSAGNLMIFGETSGTNWVRLWNGALGSQVDVDTDAGAVEMSGDVDDFGLGLVVMPANNLLWFSSSYGGAFTQMSGLTGVNGTDNITIVRIPRKTTSGAFNNNVAAMEIFYSISRSAIYRAIYNFSSNAVVSVTDITYTATFPYGVFSAPDKTSTVISYGHTLETYANNANLVAATLRHDTGGAVIAPVFSDDGGATWTDVSSAIVNFAAFHHWVEPIRGGDGMKAWGISPNVLKRTTDRWATAVSVTYPSSLLSNGNPQGVFQL